MYALIFCDQGLAKVVLVKSWLRIAIGLPLRLYNGINTPSGAILTGCMRGLVSASAPPEPPVHSPSQLSTAAVHQRLLIFQ